MQDRSPNDLRDPAFFSESDEERRERRPPPGLALDPPDDPPPEHPPEIPVERLDSDALRVVARLRHMRHRAYFVGGCVRDLLLDAKPKDFDVATDAHPGEVRAIFRNCRLIGRRFRLAHVYFRGGKVIEVATFRKNPTDVAEDVGGGDAPDGDLLITRDNVFGTAEEDAVRRDFTVNGLFYDVATGEVIDYVGGRADLEARRIATIGDPEIRVREDPVRSLRAIRFASRLGFIIAPDTFEAMRRNAGELARCAPPRVLEEIFKILRCGGSSRAFELMRACGALQVVLPAVGAALDSWSEERRKGFFAHLSALDRLVRSGEVLSEAVLLGALLMHLAPAPHEDAADELRNPHVPRFAEAEAFLATLVQTSRLPRKIAERTRLALHAQRLFREPPRKRRRRGRGLAGQPYFQDAIQLLEISVDATGEGAEILERFRGEGERPQEERELPRRGERRSEGRGAPRGPDRPPRPAPAADVGAAEAPGASRPGPELEAGEEGEEGEVSAEIEVGAEGSPTGGPSPEGAHGTGRRRRRRRGGRRRRRRGVGAQGPEGGATPAPVAATGE
ncbi:polynucleotide adenylyltransferase PcnB [Anaeromyxobacter oryzisoli]|uniref:polynucleotide adenylyltransferase PcnB n=1 Tax=Anaeromyxobacter oryzisoli TaxID=2925408 RepID=UPI001F566701|nr:polynucleotide adenylyltransferase PcnB [Anaeromyxobacter sp. SG63]